MTGTVSLDASEAIRRTLHHEGGYVNDPSDRGGATKYGITQATLAKWRGGAVAVQDVRDLTEDEAFEIYNAWYWIAPGIWQLPSQDLRMAVYDWGVNSGPKRSIKALQKVVGCTADGVIGPITVAQTEAAIHAKGWGIIVSDFCDERERFYRAIVERDPTQKKFLKGWLRRNESFRPKGLKGTV